MVVEQLGLLVDVYPRPPEVPDGHSRFCKTQPLCTCLGETQDEYAEYECECFADPTGMNCRICGAVLVTEKDD